MNEVTNLDGKRICDMSADKYVIVIRKKGCVTRIVANSDRTLRVTHERAPPGDEAVNS